MQRVPRHAATTVVLRGVLALVVATVGLMCLFGRAAQHQAASRGEVSVSEVVAAQSPTAAGDRGPCGKTRVVTESGTQRADTGRQPAAVPASPASTDRAAASPSFSGASLFRGPAPPPPLALLTVLRM